MRDASGRKASENSGYEGREKENIEVGKDAIGRASAASEKQGKSQELTVANEFILRDRLKVEGRS